jgi:hypothetical protein
MNKFKKSILLSPVALLPILPMQCDGGDSAPTVACNSHWDGTPDGGVCHAWGASGYVQMDIICENEWGTDWTETGPEIRFDGGGSAMEGGLWFNLSCHWFYPNYVYHGGWSWG